MKSLKQEILTKIYETYETWLGGEEFVCQKGCSSCCTQAVTMTAIEGDLVYDYLEDTGRSAAWLADHLLIDRPSERKLHHTANSYARMFLEQKDHIESEDQSYDAVCPFLEKDMCTIYPVRPFSCRSFASKQPCSLHGSAYLPANIVAINTVTMQIIEHLGQREYWGGMIDVMLVMAETRPVYRDMVHERDTGKTILAARTRMLKAEPLPGFLAMPEEEAVINAYIKNVLEAKIGNLTLEQVFNNQR